MTRPSPLLRALCLAVLACGVRGASAYAADHEALVIGSQLGPVRVEGARFFDDGTLMSVAVRNTGHEVARLTLRIVVFDEYVRLRGGVTYCVGDPLQPGTRRILAFPLDVKDASTRDRMIVLAQEVVTLGREFRVAESLGAIIEQARDAANLRTATLTPEEDARAARGADARDLPPCPCSCERAVAAGDEGCAAAGLSAFTCTPAPGASCSSGFTCKR